MRALLILGLMGYLTAGQAIAETITVAWRDKAPYHYRENGHARGFLLLRAKHIFALAKVPARFVERPSKRIWLDFQNGKANYCSIGWYRLPEREQIAQFSRPFHVDPPHTLLVNASALALIQTHKTLTSLLADPSVTLGLVDGVSYGADLDAQIAHSANQIKRMTISPSSMVHMLAANRFHYMLVDQADWQHLREQDDDLSQIAEYHVSDMPAGLKRFIVCSNDVTVATMARINHAITATVSKQNNEWQHH